MAMERKSKLKPYAERLDQWFGVEHLSIAEVQKKLWEDCSVRVSSGRLSEWWSERQAQQMQDKFLATVASGARQCQEVEKQFGKNPPPDLETLVKMLRVLVMDLTIKGATNPLYLEFADGLIKRALEFAKLQTRQGALELLRSKFQRETCELFLKWFANKAAKDIATSSAPAAEKIELLGQQMFGEDWN
jgi:hypothetical protein